MSKLLSSILQAREPKFTYALQELEKGSGNRSLDVHLTSEVLQSVHLKHRELGLDILDTTGNELYQSLNQLFKLHDGFLTQKLDIVSSDDLPAATIKIQKLLTDKELIHKVWTVKPVRIKQLIKSIQPKKAMKKLGYRSVDSFTRRETSAQLLFAVRLFESSAVQKTVEDKLSRLKQSDFEYREVCVDTPTSRQWKQIAQEFTNTHKHTIALVKEVSTIIALPAPIKHLPGAHLLLASLILYFANELKTMSAQCLMSRLDKDFGKTIGKIFYDGGKEQIVQNSNLKTDWRVLHRYYGKQEDTTLFEPHLQAEDLIWRSAEDLLYEIEPALYFWKDLDYVGWPTNDGLVSFNLLDVGLNVANGLKLGSHCKHHMQDSLWNELYLRYLAESPLEQSLLRKIVPYSTMEALEV